MLYNLDVHVNYLMLFLLFFSLLFIPIKNDLCYEQQSFIKMEKLIMYLKYLNKLCTEDIFIQLNH
jgi:hypothetical protein